MDASSGKWEESAFDAARLFTHRTSQFEVSVSNYGATVTQIRSLNRAKQLGHVVVGHDTLEGYLHHSRYFGCVVGRCCNRIQRGKFMLEGKEYQLAINNGLNALHGGLKGFDKLIWEAQLEEDGHVLSLSLRSPDGDEGYPGTVDVRVRYSVEGGTSLRIEYEATAVDATTMVNLTNHSYFNLDLDSGADITWHELQLFGSHFAPVDETLIPTGELRPTRGTNFDFCDRRHRIGERIEAECDEQLRFTRGYDHSFAVDEADGKHLRRAASLRDPRSGRVLEVLTTEPAVQLYTGNFLDGSLRTRTGPIPFRGALCLETQKFPDAVNKPQWRDSVVLKKGEKYSSVTVFKFTTEL